MLVILERHEALDYDNLHPGGASRERDGLSAERAAAAAKWELLDGRCSGVSSVGGRDLVVACRRRLPKYRRQ